jgi:hypothetical protein
MKTKSPEECSEQTKITVIAASPYVDVSWYQEFFDQEGGAIHSFEFKIPPAPISKGEFVQFAFSNDSGRVIDVRHYIRDTMRPGCSEKPQLKHFIRIVLDTRLED